MAEANEDPSICRRGNVPALIAPGSVSDSWGMSRSQALGRLLRNVAAQHDQVNLKHSFSFAQVIWLFRNGSGRTMI